MEFSKMILPNNKSYYKNAGSIARLINYTLAPGKSYYDGKFLKKVHYCASNCVDISTTYSAVCQIKAIKQFYDKLDGRQMYHYILSFPSSVQDPHKVYEIGMEIMHTFFKDYQTVFAVHEDTDNLHIHFVFNSVSYVTGKKWCPKYKEFYRLKEAVEHMADSHFCRNDISVLLR